MLAQGGSKSTAKPVALASRTTVRFRGNGCGFWIKEVLSLFVGIAR